MFESSAPKHPSRTDATIAQRVIALRRQHPTWGQQRIAHELANASSTGGLARPTPHSTSFASTGRLNQQAVHLIFGQPVRP